MLFLGGILREGRGKVSLSWYPGHMAKAKRLLQDQLRRADIVVEVCDARIPVSSRNPDLASLAQNRPRLVVLNKADLADPAQTTRWLAYFAQQHIPALSLNAKANAAALAKVIEKTAQPRVAAAAQRGMRKTVRVIILGVPNVGKSSLINRLSGRSATSVADRPGVTRALQWVKLTPYLELMDSPGLLWPKLEDQQGARRLAYVGSIKDETLDVYALASSLADLLIEQAPHLLVARYGELDVPLRGQALMEALCRARGYLVKGNNCDLLRAAVSLLDDFRGGKIGRITLETAPTQTIKAEGHGED